MPGRLDRLVGPERARPALVCCTPYSAPAPSGWAWFHSRSCPWEPRQKVRPERAPRRDAPLTPAQADRLRPTGGTALLCWLTHPEGCRCYGCSYTDAHLDEGGPQDDD
jgi:hypothetical protein